jgi:signal transduction histidine kinase
MLTGLSFLPCSAQEITMERNQIIDSLYQLINGHTKDDQEKVRLLNEYARQCFFNSEFQRGLIATKNAWELSGKIKFEGGKIMYALTLATFHGNGESMYRFYKRQAEWLSMGSNDNYMHDYTDLVFPDNYPGDIGKSINRLLDSYKYFEKIGDKEILASIINPIKTYYYFQSNYPETQRYVDVASDLYHELGMTYPYYLYKTFTMRILIAEGKEEAAKNLELELVDLIEKSEDTIGLLTRSLAFGFSNSGRYALATEYHLKSIEAFKNTGNQKMLAETYRLIGIVYQNYDMYGKAIESYKKYLAIGEILQDSSIIYGAYNYVVSPLISLKKYEEAREYINLALQDPDPGNNARLLAGYNNSEGQILMDQGKYAEAIPYFTEALNGIKQIHNSRWDAPFIALSLADCYMQTGDLKKSLDYGLISLELENSLNSDRTNVKNKISLLLSSIYDKIGNRQKAYEYLKMHQAIRAESDSLDASNKIKDAEVRAILDKNQEEINQLEEDRMLNEQQNRLQRLWIFSIAVALISAIILSLILYRNNKSKQKANSLLKEQKEEIQVTLEKLEKTQTQLIQSAKMASLGELTAGIAHEIQNPLNFVNNFSEVSKELVEELKGESLRQTEERDGELENELLNDIDDNLDKINHHGLRASGIVKAMLEHSRSSKGVKELTDINKLADEYLHLAYHGLRAKDRTFNTEFRTDYDPSFPKTEVVPQDIGRVLLNLINNAFYASTTKASTTEDKEYKSLVTVSTKKLDESIEIRIKDNGEGISEKIRNKIFQPFFTTKPTGHGTGLGLSLSYDIVKAHGGQLDFESVINKGTEFKISLPF